MILRNEGKGESANASGGEGDEKKAYPTTGTKFKGNKMTTKYTINAAFSSASSI